MIELCITKTSRPAGRNQQRYGYDTTRETFTTLAQARAFLRDTYGTCKRQPMYIDTPADTKHVGWVYGYIEKDRGTDGRRHTYYLQDWVAFYETTRMAINPNAKA